MRKGALVLAAGAVAIAGLAVFSSQKETAGSAEAEQATSTPSKSFVLEILPERIVQGNPVLLRVPDTGEPVTMTLNGRELGTFRYGGYVSALVGVDLNANPGTSTVRAVSGSQSLDALLIVEERRKVTAPLGIPQKLGGNTVQSARRLVSTLASDNAALMDVSSAPEALWRGDFGYPLEEPVVTDEYGYTRLTVGQEIAHKGTDFRAPEGTPVYAMNRGIVALVGEFRNYGKTIAVDHGLGLMTLYMHLSDTGVEEGAMVEKGDLLGLSGKTGYADAAHLHVTVRIEHVPVDPIAFLALF